MDADDFGGAAWGGLGGLVRWFRERLATNSWWERLTAAVGSVVAAVGVGHLTYVLMRWQLPDVPSTVSAGCSFVSGVASGIILQFAVALVTELATRFKASALDRLAPPATAPPAAGTSSNGPAPAAGPADKPPAGP